MGSSPIRAEMSGEVGPGELLLVFSSLSSFGRRSRSYEFKQARRQERRSARDYRRQARRS